MNTIAFPAQLLSAVYSSESEWMWQSPTNIDADVFYLLLMLQAWAMQWAQEWKYY